MSRLTAAAYLENGKLNNHFSTSYKYDLMGNILTLRREGLLDSGDYGTIDDLTYSYEGNQVVKIDDAADQSPNYSGAMHFRDAANEETEYTYDANGNMLTDSNKGITSIDYNVLDLPQCIKTKPRIIFKESTGNAIYYTYSADGTKLRATYKEADSRTMPYKPNTSYNNNTGININTSGMVTPSVKPLESNYHYCSNLVYNNDRLSAILFDGGYASVDEGGGIVMHFYVKDHLGSNRLVVDGNGNIEEVNHYYPFGALMGDRCGVSRNKYKYIGKELDTMYGWNMQDHEARWYDPVVGRWMATDPLQEKYESVSSYCYTANYPIRFVDTDGKVIKLPKGTTYKQIFIVLGNIQKLTDDKVVFSTQKDGSIRIKIASIGNGTKSAGTRLIQRINSSKRIMTINVTSKTADGNSETDDNPANAINGIGSNVNVYFDPNSNPLIPTLNAKTGRVNGEKRPAHVGLAHELIHGDRSMRGVAIDYSENATYTYTNSRGQRVKQSLKKEEAATIGLKHVKKDDITENDIRKEQGLKLRGAYIE